MALEMALQTPPPMKAERLSVDFFVGRWSLARSITSGETMTGSAEFESVRENVLHYEETGTMRLAGGGVFSFERRYIYEVKPRLLVVSFFETPPRLFQAVPLEMSGQKLVGDALHVCSPDEYRSRYTFDGADQFQIAHRVTGPKKDYGIVTQFVRG